MKLEVIDQRYSGFRICIFQFVFLDSEHSFTLQNSEIFAMPFFHSLTHIFCSLLALAEWCNFFNLAPVCNRLILFLIFCCFSLFENASIFASWNSAVKMLVLSGCFASGYSSKSSWVDENTSQLERKRGEVGRVQIRNVPRIISIITTPKRPKVKSWTVWNPISLERKFMEFSTSVTNNKIFH